LELKQTSLNLPVHPCCLKPYKQISAQGNCKQIITPEEGRISVAVNPPQVDILVAEDNEVNQIVFHQILEKMGLNFKIVENGRLALAAYKAQPPRIILMDISMPEMNGKEATIAIREHEASNNMIHTPIIGVTAHALKGDMESCLEAGMDDYLSKPISPNDLTMKVKHWLQTNAKSQTS